MFCTVMVGCPGICLPMCLAKILPSMSVGPPAAKLMPKFRVLGVEKGAFSAANPCVHTAANKDKPIIKNNNRKLFRRITLSFGDVVDWLASIFHIASLLQIYSPKIFVKFIGRKSFET